MSKNKYVNLKLKCCTLLPTFVCLNTWSLFLDISLCALLISRPSSTVIRTHQTYLVGSIYFHTKLMDASLIDEVFSTYGT